MSELIDKKGLLTAVGLIKAFTEKNLKPTSVTTCKDLPSDAEINRLVVTIPADAADDAYVITTAKKEDGKVYDVLVSAAKEGATITLPTPSTSQIVSQQLSSVANQDGTSEPGLFHIVFHWNEALGRYVVEKTDDVWSVGMSEDSAIEEGTSTDTVDDETIYGAFNDSIVEHCTDVKIIRGVSLGWQGTTWSDIDNTYEQNFLMSNTTSSYFPFRAQILPLSYMEDNIDSITVTSTDTSAVQIKNIKKNLPYIEFQINPAYSKGKKARGQVRVTDTKSGKFAYFSTVSTQIPDSVKIYTDEDCTKEATASDLEITLSKAAGVNVHSYYIKAFPESTTDALYTVWFNGYTSQNVDNESVEAQFNTDKSYTDKKRVDVGFLYSDYISEADTGDFTIVLNRKRVRGEAEYVEGKSTFEDLGITFTIHVTD